MFPSLPLFNRREGVVERGGEARAKALHERCTGRAAEAETPLRLIHHREGQTRRRMLVMNRWYRAYSSLSLLACVYACLFAASSLHEASLRHPTGAAFFVLTEYNVEVEQKWERGIVSRVYWRSGGILMAANSVVRQIRPWSAIVLPVARCYSMPKS